MVKPKFHWNTQYKKTEYTHYVEIHGITAIAPHASFKFSSEKEKRKNKNKNKDGNWERVQTPTWLNYENANKMTRILRQKRAIIWPLWFLTGVEITIWISLIQKIIYFWRIICFFFHLYWESNFLLVFASPERLLHFEYHERKRIHTKWKIKLQIIDLDLLNAQSYLFILSWHVQTSLFNLMNNAHNCVCSYIWLCVRTCLHNRYRLSTFPI